MYIQLSNQWRMWQYKGWTYLVLFALIAMFVGLTISSTGKSDMAGEEKQKALPEVRVQTLEEIARQATVDTTTSFELQNAAPLISRLGGRVTAVYAPLGSKVGAGQIVVAIDGGSEPNGAVVQAASAAKQLQLFAAIETQTRASLDTAVAIAIDSFASAQAGKALGAQVQLKNQELAENAVDGARTSREKSITAGDDILIRSANLSVSAAKLAQDQAQLAREIALRQSTDAVTMSQKGLQSAEIARSQTLASLASQKAGLAAQFRAAAEQVKTMQVIAPISGEVSRLSVNIGDFVRPGDTVGEVATLGNTKGTIFVPGAVKESLFVGKEIAIFLDDQEKSARIAAIAGTSSGASSLWQVDITTNEVVSPNSTVRVSLPIATRNTTSIFVPLDALNVREGGTVLFTLGQENVVREHEFTPLHYYNTLVEGTALLPLDSKVIVTGNRTLTEGDSVKVLE